MSAQSPEPFLASDFWFLKSDLQIDTAIKYGETHYSYQQELDELFEKKEIPIIFLRTELLPKYLSTLMGLSGQFILIMTSNDDHCVPFLQFPNQDEQFKQAVMALIEKEELISCFAKNPCLVHPKIIPFPLGPKWQWKNPRFFGEDKTEHLRIFNELCLSPKEKLLDNELKQNLLYFNFKESTTGNPLYAYHQGIRQRVKKEIQQRFLWNDNAPFERYMHMLQTYKFCLAPPGRGIDTHRTWEALMLGTIPIIISSPQDSLFEKLPVIILQDEKQLMEITPEYLQHQHQHILSKVDSYEFDILYTEYWQKQLEQQKNKI